MVPVRRFGAVDLVLFLYIVLMAAGARGAYLMLSADNGRNDGPLTVQAATDSADIQALAASVKESNTFKSQAPLSAGPEETAHASPGYPWLLGMLGRVVSADQLPLYMRWGQCGLGALTAGLYFLFCRRAFRSMAVAILAGMLCALNPFTVVNTAQIDDGVLASLFVALALFTGVRASQTGAPFASLLYGLGLAGAALVRAALLPFAFVGLAWFLMRSRRLPSGWLGALLGFLGFVIGVAPWTVRNWQVFHEPIAIVDSAYLHLWMGNNPQADGGPVDPEAVLSEDQVQELKGEANQPRRYSRLGHAVWNEVRRDPPAVAQRRLQAAWSFFFGAPPQPHSDEAAGRMHVVGASTSTSETLKVFTTYEAMFLWTLLGMIFFALLGWRWSYGWAAESTPAAIAMIWLPLPYILSHADLLSGARLPLDGVMLCYASFALLCFVPGVRRRLLGGALVAAGPQPH